MSKDQYDERTKAIQDHADAMHRLAVAFQDFGETVAAALEQWTDLLAAKEDQ